MSAGTTGHAVAMAGVVAGIPALFTRNPAIPGERSPQLLTSLQLAA